jgi:hypothetical protein
MEIMLMSKHLAVQAIKDWKAFPELGRVFESIVDYNNYLMCDFNTLVDQYQKENKCTHTEAIRAIAYKFPEVHQKFIAVSNIVRPAVTPSKVVVIS